MTASLSASAGKGRRRRKKNSLEQWVGGGGGHTLKRGWGMGRKICVAAGQAVHGITTVFPNRPPTVPTSPKFAVLSILERCCGEALLILWTIVNPREVIIFAYMICTIVSCRDSSSGDHPLVGARAEFTYSTHRHSYLYRNKAKEEMSPKKKGMKADMTNEKEGLDRDAVSFL